MTLLTIDKDWQYVSGVESIAPYVLLSMLKGRLADAYLPMKPPAIQDHGHAWPLSSSRSNLL
jgi:hypothetical protein